jgi:RimJ/RimL family protein N-acetyltransferase
MERPIKPLEPMKPFDPPRVIETERLWLRPFVESDAEQLFYALLGDPDVMEWLPRRVLESVDEAILYIRECEAGWNNKTMFTWVFEDKETGHLCSMLELRPCLPRIELGVASAQKLAWRRRRASLEAFRKLVHWTIAQPNVYRIHAFCSPYGKSAPTMEKLGFKYEGRLTNWEARPNRGLVADDAMLFALTRVPPSAEESASATESAIDMPSSASPSPSTADTPLPAASCGTSTQEEGRDAVPA